MFIRVVLILVFLYLVVKNWQGTTSLIRQTGNSSAGIIKTLQGR
jgi:hypothetical protein